MSGVEQTVSSRLHAIDCGDRFRIGAVIPSENPVGTQCNAAARRRFLCTSSSGTCALP
jgi:hypothetical protein